MGADKRSAALWNRYCRFRQDISEVGLSLDISRVRFPEDYLDRVQSRIVGALGAMECLELGAVANSDEGRLVGHYWLRAPHMAPSAALNADIRRAIDGVETFARQVSGGSVCGAAGPFKHVVHIGIGGSAIGPQFLHRALGRTSHSISFHFLDNCDPHGLNEVMECLSDALGQTLVLVVSKSGWTPTSQYLQRELEHSYSRAGLDFSRHAVAVTMEGSDLDQRAVTEAWLARFPIWEWVGGRTSITSPVGLLPAALLGANIRDFLHGAAVTDVATRRASFETNPAALLALMWYWLGNGHGDKDMVILPYKDGLSLFPRYIQQLVMESVGKKLDRTGAVVHQGLTVYGYKGATDQHSYGQQLRDGTPNFFALFIQTYEDGTGPTVEGSSDVTLGDYLFSSLEATRNALYERGRDSITIAIPSISASAVGALVALFERAVGLYAELVDVNAYHQPGVDKRVADQVAELHRIVLAHLRGARVPQTPQEIAISIGMPEQVETVYKILEHLAHNAHRGISRLVVSDPFSSKFYYKSVDPPMSEENG